MKRNLPILKLNFTFMTIGLCLFLRSCDQVTFADNSNNHIKNNKSRGPKIIVEPRDVIFDVSAKSHSNQVKLRCVADAFPEPVYTWFKESQQSSGPVGIAIDPLQDERLTQTDGTLSIYNPSQNSDKGKYYCTAANEFGRVISQTVTITFGFILEFSKKRSIERGKENWGKSISCDEPQHYPKALYYWIKSEFPNFVREDKRVFISRDGNLYFSSLEKIDSSNYSCQLQSTISSTGRFGPTFALIVEPASSGQKLQFANGFPKLFPEGSSLLGQDVRLECMAYGYPTPTYNWTRVGSSSRLPSTHSIQNDGKVLMLPKIRIQDGGEYVCRASSETDSLHKSVIVTVQASPNFTTPLKDITVGDRESVTLFCEAFGLPSVTYTWYKNGIELSHSALQPFDSQRYIIRDNRFYIEGVMREQDSGMYQCRATNQYGTATSTAQLRVTSMKPNFDINLMPSKVNAMVDHNLSIPCSVEAVPKAIIRWTKDGYGIEDKLRVKSSFDGTLNFNPVRISDSGVYECQAENQFGVSSLKTLLSVNPLPLLYETPEKKTFATYGDKYKVLACQVQSYYPLETTNVWLRNDMELNTDGGSKYYKAENGQLVIQNVSYIDEGNYTCKVVTPVGSVQHHGLLLVRGPPDACGGVIAENITFTSARIIWSDGSNHFSRIWANTIEARTNHNQTWHVLASNISAMLLKNSHSLIDRKYFDLVDLLLPSSIYEFRVAATNDYGQGPPSEPSRKYRTDSSAPRFPVTNVRGGGGKAGTLSIKWSFLPNALWGSNELWYQVYFRLHGSLDWTKRELISAGGLASAYTVNIGADNYYRLFDVMVQPINPLGAGPLSDIKQIYSAQQMPRIQPTNVYGIAHNSTALNVTWNPIDDKDESGKLIGYRIRYWPSGKDSQTYSLVSLKRSLEPWALVVGLQPETEYNFAVMAFNEAGSGPESEHFRLRTFKAAPQRAPTSVKAEFINETDLKVTWRGIPSVATNEEPVIGYKVRYWLQDEPLSSAKDIILRLGSELEVIVTNLVAGETYKLRVLAFSSGGDGKMSSPELIIKRSTN